MNSHRRQTGAALVIALSVTVLLASLTAALLFRGTTERRQARAFTRTDQAVLSAESGMHRLASAMRSGAIRLISVDPNDAVDPEFPFVFELDPNAPGTVLNPLNTDFPLVGDPILVDFRNNAMVMAAGGVPVVTSFGPLLILRDEGDPASPRITRGTALDPEEIEFLVQGPGTTAVDAAGRLLQARMRLRVYADSIYKNAIASGGATTSFSGNVSLHGSAYMRGQSIELETVFEIGGTARAWNSYDTSSTQQTFGNTALNQAGTIYMPNDPNDPYHFDRNDLDSRLQVLRGNVSISGNATVGVADNPYTKIMVDGYYNGGLTTEQSAHPFFGNEVSVQPGTKVPELDFPPVQIPADALVITPEDLRFLNKNDAACSATPQPLVTRANAFGFVEFNPCNGETRMGGQVVMRPATGAGSLTLGLNAGSGANNRHYQILETPETWTDPFTGLTVPADEDARTRGTSIFADVGPGGTLTLGTGVQVMEFPRQSFGLFSTGRMNVDPGGTGGQGWPGTFTGLYYANEDVVFSKQVVIGGTVIGRRGVDTLQVPDIYQVPMLIRNLPPGTPQPRIVLTVEGFVGFRDWIQLR